MRKRPPVLAFTRAMPMLLAVTLSISLTAPVKSNAQDFELDSSAFDDDMFGDNLFSDTPGSSPFTYKVSQQGYSQLNNHGLVGIDGSPEDPGTEISRTSLLVKYQNAFAPGWLLQGSAQAKVYWPGDYEHKANHQRIDTDLRLNEMFVQRSGERHSVSLGRQTVVWGETEGNSVLDVINTSEFRDLTIIDIEDARRNQWLLVWDYFSADRNTGTGNSGSWSSFFNLYPEFNPAPVRGSPFFFEPPFNLTTYQRSRPLFEAGTRWSRSFRGSDVSLMAARLYENQLRYNPPGRPGEDANPQINGYWLLGASANRVIGRLLLKLDVAYSRDVLADTFLQRLGEPAVPSTTRTSQIGTSFGFEYAITNEQNISVGVLAQRLLENERHLETHERLVDADTAGNVLLRYSNSMRNSTLLLNVTAQSALDGSTLLTSIALNYNLDDRWALMGQVIATRAEEQSALFFLDEDVRVGLTLSCAF